MSVFGGFGKFSGGDIYKTPQQIEMEKQRQLARAMWNQDGTLQIGNMTVAMPQQQKFREAPLTGGDQQAVIAARRAPIAGMSQLQGTQTPSMGGALAKGIAALGMSYMGGKQNRKEAAALKKTLGDENLRKEDIRLAAIDQEQERYAQNQAHTRSRESIEDAQYAEGLAEEKRLNDARIEDFQKKASLGTGKTMYDPKTGASDTYRPSADGTGTWVDSTGKKASLDGLLDYTEYIKALKDEAAANARGGLTENQMRLGMETLQKKTAPMQAIHDRINVIDSLLAPYMVGSGDDREEQDVPGLGFGEGYRGLIGDAWRMAQGQDSRQINAAFAGLVADEIRQQAGTAQTLHETANVMRSLAQQGLSEEGAALKGYMDIRDSFQRAVKLLAASTHPSVMDEFRGNYKAIGDQSIFDNYLKPIDFSQVEKVGGNIPASASQAVLNEAGLTQAEWDATPDEDRDLLSPNWRDDL